MAIIRFVNVSRSPGPPAKRSAIIRYVLDKTPTTHGRTCQHRRTQLIAKDNEAQYLECLECGEILELGELAKPEKREGASFDESLSDA